MEEIKKNLDKWRPIEGAWRRRLILSRCHFFPTEIYIQCNLDENSSKPFFGYWQTSDIKVTFIWKGKRPEKPAVYGRRRTESEDWDYTTSPMHNHTATIIKITDIVKE